MSRSETVRRSPRAKARRRTEPDPPAEIPQRLIAVLVFAALMLFAGLSIWEMSGDSITIDERVYLPAGYAYWTQRDFTLNPEHPPLAKLLAALPLLAMDLKAPAVADSSAGAEPRSRQAEAERQMAFGSEFLYSRNADRIMFWGRLPMVALGLLLGVWIFLWSKELHGHAGAGLISLFLFALEPTLIAHSHYVATDVPLASFTVMALYFLYRFCRDAKPGQLIIAAAALGCAMASKFSAIFLVPIFFFLLLYRWPSEKLAIPYLADFGPVASRMMALVAVFSAAAVTIHATYLFIFDPWLYLRGLLAVNVNELPQSVLTYVHGKFVAGGVWWYPLYAGLLKTPLPALMVIAAASAATLAKGGRACKDLEFVVLPAAAYTLATCVFANNLGVRYMIPVLALLLVFAGRTWVLCAATRNAGIIGAVLMIWLTLSVLRISPHHISYFNELVGGPKNGPYYLDDSNIDWGQDLRRLTRYLENRTVKELVLSYWGPTPPEYYLGPRDIQFAPWNYELAGSPSPPPGLYAISVNQLIMIKREQQWLNRPLNTNLDWLARFKPADRIGYSIYIYEFPPAAKP